MKDIGEIDKRLNFKTSIEKENIAFYDAKEEPFKLYGISKKDDDNIYKRVPTKVAKEISEAVAILSTQTAGIRVRFSTNSSYIAIKAKIANVLPMTNMTILGQAGFDLYEDFEDQKSSYIGSFMPPQKSCDEFEAIVELSTKKCRSFTINFPLYNDVYELYIGIEDNSILSFGQSYKAMPPIVYYGSSITQGGCASRPGTSYQGIISRENNIDYINLGFSGNAKGEKAMAEYIASLEMSVFVCDYDHNVANALELEETHMRFYKKVREKNKNIPIILVSKPDFSDKKIEDIIRREIIQKTYTNAINGGDKNIYYIDGETLFDPINKDASTVDGCHPNDFGFIHMARRIGSMIEYALKNK